MDVTASPLRRFLPRFLREHPAAAADTPLGYEEWALRGALLFVDIVGFTAQVDRLVARGPEGIELANERLNDVIGGLVAELTAGGGDVAVFAGDALFVLWPAFDEERGLAPAIARAGLCALSALHRHAQRPAETRPQLRFSLGASAFSVHRVGGHADRWHGLLSGPALHQVGRADALAQNDALVASPEAQAMANDGLLGDVLEHGMMRVRKVREESRKHAPLLLPECSPAQMAQQVAETVAGMLADPAPPDAHWLAEFRDPSVIFARLPGLLRDGALDGVRAQEATCTVQRIVAELAGTILQFVIDDKGPVFIIAFGLAARVHEDDPARAALAALRIVAELTALGTECGVGVATGRAFCGLIGSSERCNYTLIGQTMNLAARLMQRASPGPLFDERTQERSRDRVDFVHEGVIRVKGLDAPVQHYLAIAPRSEILPPEAERDATLGLIGRARELGILEGQLEALVRERRSALVVLVGEAGIGKSRLVRELVSRAEQSSVLTLVASAGAIESAPHARWRPCLQALLGRRRAADPAAADALVENPYLRAFLGQVREAMPEVDDAERAFRTREAIAGTVLETSRGAPLLLCVEDAHSMDSLSWSVVTRLAQGLQEAGNCLMLVLTTRELEGHAPADALTRLARTGMLRLPLGPLAMEDRALVAQAAIGAASLSPAAASWVGTHSGGNPLFCRELAAAALESGELQLADGRAELSAAQTRAQTTTRLPETLQGLIASRLDRLDSAQQQTLRMAAVIGVRFTAEALVALREGDETRMWSELSALQERGFLDPDPGGAAGQYAFHHALVRDAAYDSLPYRRRRELHARLATWLEWRFGEDLAPHAAALALHWERAEDWERAFSARLRAGEAALQSYANREAAEHFGAASTLRSRVAALRAHVRASSPELGLARAQHRMGDERASRAHIEDALRSSGERVPARKWVQALGVLREFCWRLLPLTPRCPAGLRASPRLRATVQAYDLLPEILYYDNDLVSLVYVTLRFLRLAEAESRPTAEYARALGWWALLRAGVSSRDVADKGFDRALVVADASSDPAVDAWLRLVRGSTLAQFGAWTEAELWLRDARERCAAMGDRTRWWNVTSAVGHVLSYRGELAAGAEVLLEALALNRDTDNPVFLCWGLAGHAGILHRLGDPAERADVVRRLRSARAALSQRPDASADLFSRGLLAAALWRDEQREEAFELARDTIDDALDRAPMVWLQVSSYLGLTEVLREAGREPARQAEALRLMLRMERSLRTFARLIPVGRPALGLLRGEIELLIGRPARARKRLVVALRIARELGLPLEAGKLHLAIAETSPPGESAAELDQAIEVFQRINARFSLGLARERRALGNAEFLQSGAGITKA